MGEGDAGAGQHQDRADPQWRRSSALGLLIKRRLTHGIFQGEQQQRGANEANDRREQERMADIDSLTPIDARGAVADNGADQGMRRGSRKAKPTKSLDSR